MRRPNTFLITVLSVALYGVGACSPTAPSGASGATINGKVVPATAGAAPMGVPRPELSTIPPGMTVSVDGTAITAPVSSSGNFVLVHVPAGNAGLRFSAAGVLAVAALNGLQNGQTVDIAVTVTETTAEIASDHRSTGPDEQLGGLVESLPPTAAAGTLMVAGRVITTNSSTKVSLLGVASSFNALAVGQRVLVTGQNTGSLFARTIDIQDTTTTAVVTLNGTTSNFNGTSTAFEFEVSGKLVKGDLSTQFFGNSRFEDLADGVRVEVKGSLRNGFVYAQRIDAIK